MSSGLFGDGAVPGAAAGKTIAKYGIYDEKIEPGSTVGEARQKMIATAAMPADAKAYINGELVNDDARVPANVTLNFTKRSGEKGV